MIIDSHAHVMLPPQLLLDKMNAAGVERTILFPTSVHPETASDLKSMKSEMQKLNRILAGEINPQEAQRRSMEELTATIAAFPENFLGFGRVPMMQTAEETAEWIETEIIQKKLIGLGEFTMAPGQVAGLEVVFQVSSEMGNLPLWIHTFFPMGLQDIMELDVISRRFPTVPVILGHLGGVNWMDAIALAKVNPQIYLDLSAVFTAIAPAMAIRELPDRTLFASDAPYGDPYLVRQMVEHIVPEASVRDKVLGENITRLLHL